MKQTSKKTKLDILEEKINEVKSNEIRDPSKSFKVQNDGWRMVIELVAGMIIGITIGMTLDFFVQTKPLFLIVFTLLGFLAGVKTMMKTAKSIKQEALENK